MFLSSIQFNISFSYSLFVTD